MSFSNFQAPVFHKPTETSDAKWTVSANDVANKTRVVAEFAVSPISKFQVDASKKLAMAFIRAMTPMRPYAWQMEYIDGSTKTFEQAVCPEGLENRAFPLYVERDNCEVCYGARGGVKGNENLIDGVVTCDYCYASRGRGEHNANLG